MQGLADQVAQGKKELLKAQEQLQEGQQDIKHGGHSTLAA